MKVRRTRWTDSNGDVHVHYMGMFQCICGGRTPFIEEVYIVEVLKCMKELSYSQLREYIRIRRKDMHRRLEEFVLTSELCHDGENK
jgi:hypothetical protein